MRKFAVILLLLTITFVAKGDGVYSYDGYGGRSISGSGALSLTLGRGRLIYYPLRVKSLFIADPRVADFKVKSPGVIYLLPKSLGRTNLMGVDKQNNIIFNKTIIVSLNIPVIQGLIRKVSPTAKIKIDTAKNVVMLRGMVQTPQDSQRIMTMLTSYLGRIRILNFMKVVRPAQIYLRVHVVELSRSVTQTLGLNWAAFGRAGDFNILTAFPSFQSLFANGFFGGFSGLGGLGTAGAAGGAGAALVNTTTASGNFSLTTFLDFLEQHGLATILAEPNLITLSGTQASFKAGGQFPIPVSQALGVTTVQFVNFGVSLNFTPHVLQDRLIDLKIGVTVSSLSNQGSVQQNGFNIPGLTDRSANVQVELHSGQSFAIAGLLQKNMSKTLRKYPGLAEIPILGKLFRSEQFLKNESELVIIITPYYVRPVKRTMLGDPLQLPPPEFTQWK